MSEAPHIGIYIINRLLGYLCLERSTRDKPQSHACGRDERENVFFS